MSDAQKLAVVFPGQGSQKLAMLQDFYHDYKVFRERISLASEVLGYDLWSVIQSDNDRLNQTRYTQPALLASSLGIWEVAKEFGMPCPAGLAGHSLGEYSALVAGGVLDFTDAVRLVSLRGEWMEEASGTVATGMLVVVGLNEEEIQQLRGSDDPTDHNFLVVANYNSPKQFVLSGYCTACEQAASAAKRMGAKIARLLPVSVASHSELMRKAAERLEEEFNKLTFKTPVIPIYRDVDGGIHQDPLRIPLDLKMQTVAGVQWVKIVEHLLRDGINKICECGPGHVLTGLNRQIVAVVNSGMEAEVLVESWESTEQLRSSLGLGF